MFGEEAELKMDHSCYRGIRHGAADNPVLLSFGKYQRLYGIFIVLLFVLFSKGFPVQLCLLV